MISKITSCYKPRTINFSEIRILIGQFKFIAYPYVSCSQSDNLPHNEAQFNYKGPSLQHCLQYEGYGIWLKGTLYQLETTNCLLRYVSALYNEDISYSINLNFLVPIMSGTWLFYYLLKLEVHILHGSEYISIFITWKLWLFRYDKSFSVKRVSYFRKFSSFYPWLSPHTYIPIDFLPLTFTSLFNHSVFTPHLLPGWLAGWLYSYVSS